MSVNGSLCAISFSNAGRKNCYFILPGTLSVVCLGSRGAKTGKTLGSGWAIVTSGEGAPPDTDKFYIEISYQDDGPSWYQGFV